MDITSTHKHGMTCRTSIPVHIRRAMGLTPGDHVIWTWNSKGHAELRRVSAPHELARPADKKR